MRTVPAPRIECYWRNNINRATYPAAKHMSLTHFEQLKRYLHISPIGEDAQEPAEYKRPIKGKEMGN